MMSLIELSESTLLRLLSRGAVLKISVDEVVGHLLDETDAEAIPEDVADGDFPFEEAKALALSRARAKQTGTEFRLEELFSADEWKRVPARKSLGRYFRKDAEQEGLVRHVGKTDTNHAIYQRL
jgi:hypothetical protein